MQETPSKMKLFVLVVSVLAIHLSAGEDRLRGLEKLRYCENCVNCPGCKGYNEYSDSEESSSEESFSESEETIIENKQHVFVMFYTANWCGACREIKPVLSYLMESYPNARLNMIDVDQDPEKAVAHNVRRLPTITFDLNGRELARIDNGNVNSLIMAFKRFYGR
ncbi:unnamed protein product [Phyllotreta striolata]|uniref:Thioredoxin domain-containing protein n=1 Tax=Phyllotreta striolata TaxID=444603 RepID=A0A9N9XQA5_PHYSR|nr:unnamed protein product [Phyllotreta striolata]